MHTIEADYLVVGAGAMGMAFADIPPLPDSARTRERLLQIVNSNLKAMNERLETLLSHGDVDTVTCARHDGM